MLHQGVPCETVTQEGKPEQYYSNDTLKSAKLTTKLLLSGTSDGMVVHTYSISFCSPDTLNFDDGFTVPSMSIYNITAIE